MSHTVFPRIEAGP